MAITPLPTPPSTSDPANFASKADAFLAALPLFQTEANALAAAMNLNSTTDASLSSVLIGTGAKSFAASPGKSFQPGMYLVFADAAAPSTNSMFGQVTSYDVATGALVLNVMTVRGAGTKAAWVISQSSAGGAVAGPLATSGITGAAASGTNADILALNAITSVLGSPYARVIRRQTVQNAATGGASSAVTISNATPGVVGWTAHGYEANTPLYFTTSGGLPTGLSVNTTYYVSATGLTANTFQVAATPGGASIATSSAGSGTHTATVGLYGNPGGVILGGAVGGTGITTSNINASNPLVMTAANGCDVVGNVDIIGKAVANLSWTTLSTNGTWGLYADIAGNTITPVNGCLPLPIYQTFGNYSATSGQFTFNRSQMIGKVGNGSIAVQTNRVCLGEVTVAGGVVTAIVWYALNRYAESPVTVGIPAASSKTNYNHNLGVTPLAARAKFILNTASGGFAVDDVVAQVMTRDASGYVAPMQPNVSRNAMFLSTMNANLYVIPSAGGVASDVTGSAVYSFTQIADGGW